MTVIANAVSKALWVLTLASSVLGGLNFFLTYTLPSLVGGGQEISAPQLAALAGSSLAVAAIPYVIARGWDELTRPRSGTGAA